MDKLQSHKIVKDTFQNQFDKDRFVFFIKNLLNNIDESKAFHAHGYVKHQYKQITGVVKTYERIGSYVDTDGKKIDILIVYLEKENSIDRARTTLRNFVADYLKQRDQKDAALVAFVSPNFDDWRFSLVKMDYKFEKGKTGNMKVKEEFTQAKRWSFLVGKNESCHTAQSRFVPMVANDQNNPTLSELEGKFNVETVSKEFYLKYRTLYENLVQELGSNRTFLKEAEKNNIDTKNFAKKLLGQIVFLYFLQKKGWLGAPLDKKLNQGDKSFLRTLFIEAQTKGKNYFNDCLEFLFYNSLNKKPDRSADFYRSDFNCQIPFLNGGLFEPEYKWQDCNIRLDNAIFADILDVFDLFNFTVKEDEPLDREVAIDPELLGRVFENLLPENLRKGKGTYYTPREIVHYMCQESLINFLGSNSKIGKIQAKKYVKFLKGDEKIKLVAAFEREAVELDELLKNIKVCDPACGSGAFLVGMLQEIVRLRLLLRMLHPSKLEPKNECQLKKEAIRDCIYGVDIDPGAVEIAKLRLWLSLVVDYELKDIEPLPNLDYKIMVGNSLIEILSPQLLYHSADYERNNLIDKFNSEKNKYFSISDNELKRTKRAEINTLAQSIVNYDRKKGVDSVWQKMLGHRNQTSLFREKNRQPALAEVKLTKELKKLESLNNNFSETDHFEWYLNFNEVFDKGGFDIVIANPPYIRISSISENEDEIIRSKYKTVFGHYDVYVPFIERGIDLLNIKGILSYITPNKYLIKRYANKLRPFILEKCQILKLIDTSRARTFDTASVYPVITILTKRISSEKIYVAILDDNNFEQFFHDVFEGGYFLKQDDFKNNKNCIFDISIRPESFELFRKILLDTEPLGDYARMLTGTPAIEKFYQWKKLLFPKDKLPKNKKSLKFINVSNIVEYKIDYGKRIRSVGLKLEKPYIIFDNDLIGNNKWSVFEKKKIVIKGTAKKITAAFDDIGYANVSLYAVIFNSNHDNKDKNYYHLALLNSRLINFWYCKKFASANLAGNYISFNGVYLEQIPIKKLSSTKQKLFTKIVDKILAITKSSDYLENPAKKEEVKEYEEQIDQMVYKLYGLTKDEIKIIEGKYEK